MKKTIQIDPELLIEARAAVPRAPTPFHKRLKSRERVDLVGGAVKAVRTVRKERERRRSP